MGPSEEGTHLTRQLIDLYEEVVPGTLFDPIVSALIRYLIGDTCADWLNVPHTPWDTVVKAVPRLLGVLETIEDRSSARRLGPGPPRPPHHRLRAVLPHPRTRHALRHPGTTQEGLRHLQHGAAYPTVDPTGRHSLLITQALKLRWHMLNKVQ